MFKKRLLELCNSSKKWIAMTVLMNWISIICNILVILFIGNITSGMTRSIPSISSSGKASPQSTTTMLSSYSNAVIFIPICSRPPSGMIFNLDVGFFGLRGTLFTGFLNGTGFPLFSLSVTALRSCIGFLP